MPSERLQRRIDTALDEADAALDARDWPTVLERAEFVLTLDPSNPDAIAFREAATRAVGSPGLATAAGPPASAAKPSVEQPTSFAGGRYEVRRFLGEGGKKRVFLAHDTWLDRDVALSLIKDEGLGEEGRRRVTHEAQAMGRFGDSPHVVTIYDVGEQDGQTYLVQELMTGGDVEAELREAAGPLPLARTLQIAADVCAALSYAHDRNLVHRDLKPGNVWLTAGGTAKLGDFGLAVSLDRSRLTQAGTMVGTVAYMPPEQALGGEVSPRSDLYSLGAMLYECVTGKPPFEGDHPTAIITQHVNTPPVAPSWRNDRCPPELEQLILRLLAKNPADRPSTAADVLDVIRAIDPEQPVQPRATMRDDRLSRLASGVFVGREGEIRRLQDMLDDAIAGHGSVVMIHGDPGIGKTRMVQELVTYAGIRGAQVLWSRASESTGTPPYWMWTQVGTAWASAVDLQRGGLAVLEPHATRIPELARLFPALLELPGVASPPPVSDPDAARFRLFDAGTRFVCDEAARRPLMIVLDDLHWADPPSLDLLKFLAAEIAGARVLIVGTYRDEELGRGHPLSEALAEMTRTAPLTRIALGGLSGAEVGAYIDSTTGVRSSQDVANRIYRETEGNPFFLREVVNLLTQEGSLDGSTDPGFVVPAGIREVLGRRLQALSPEALDLLVEAAVIGRDFSLDTLRLLLATDLDHLVELIDELLSSRVIDEADEVGHYRFSHALMQETLLADLSATRRLRLHAEIAEALEQDTVGRRGVAALAHHYSEGAALAPEFREKAATYCRLAAEEAERSLAWAEATELYERCLHFASPELARDPSLHRALGRTARHAAAWRTAWVSSRRAIEFYRDRGDVEAAAEATLALVSFPSAVESRLPLVDRALDGLGESGNPELRAKLLVHRLRMAGLETHEDDLYQRALDALVERHRFPEVDALVSALEVDRSLNASLLERAIELAARAHEEFRALGDLESAAAALHARAVAAGQLGALDTAKRMLDEQRDFAQASHLRQEVGHSLQGIAGFHLARCEFDAMEAALRELPDENFTKTLYAAARAEQSGDLASALALLPGAATAGGVPGYQIILHAVRARVFFNAGKHDEAAGELETWRAALERATGSLTNGMTPIEGSVGLVDECLAELGDEALVEHAYRLLTQRRGDAQPRRTIEFRGLDHARGALALRLGLIDEGAEHFVAGQVWAAQERCPVWEGRCHQGLAEIAKARGDQVAATRHLDAAAVLFADHAANLYLRQTLAEKQLLEA